MTVHARDRDCRLLERIYCLRIRGGAEAGIRRLRSDCKCRLSLAGRFDCAETIIKQLLCRLLSEPYQRVVREDELHLVAGFMVSGKCVGALPLYGCIWGQVVSPSPTLISVARP